MSKASKRVLIVGVTFATSTVIALLIGAAIAGAAKEEAIRRGY